MIREVDDIEVGVVGRRSDVGVGRGLGMTDETCLRYSNTSHSHWSFGEWAEHSWTARFGFGSECFEGVLHQLSLPRLHFWRSLDLRNAEDGQVAGLPMISLMKSKRIWNGLAHCGPTSKISKLYMILSKIFYTL